MDNIAPANTIYFPARDLDLTLKNFRTPGTRIKLEPGYDYTTRGAWAYSTFDFRALAPGVILDATGCKMLMAKDAVRDSFRPWLEVKTN